MRWKLTWLGIVTEFASFDAMRQSIEKTCAARGSYPWDPIYPTPHSNGRVTLRWRLRDDVNADRTDRWQEATAEAIGDRPLVWDEPCIIEGAQ